MAINDDYFDVREALMRLRKNKPIDQFNRIVRRMDELENENKQLKQKAIASVVVELPKDYPIMIQQEVKDCLEKAGISYE